MSRLAGMLTQQSGQAAIELVFTREKGLATVQGHIKTELKLKCQNCLETLIWPVDKQFKLGIVSSLDAANRLPDEYEPLLVEENPIPLVDIIEEELLLNIPAFPKHQQACVALEPSMLIPKKTQLHRDNPFSVLANFKKTGD